MPKPYLRPSAGAGKIIIYVHYQLTVQEITYYLHNVLTNKDLGAMPHKLHILITLRGVHHSLRVVFFVLQDPVVYNFVPERY